MSGRRDHAPEAAGPQLVGAPPHELTGGEVAEARRHVVEQDPRDVAVTPQQHHADGLVAALDLEGEVVRRQGVGLEAGLVGRDVRGVHPRKCRRYASEGPTSSTV